MLSGDDEYEWLHLDTDERVVWKSRPHPVALGRRAVVALAVAIVGLAVASWAWTNGYGPIAWLGVFLLGIGVATLAVRYLFWTNTRYVITSEELYEKRGVVSRDVSQFKLDRVQNTTLRQSVVGRLFGFGDLTVYTAGSGDPELTFDRVPDPSGANAALSRELGRDVESSPNATV